MSTLLRREGGSRDDFTCWKHLSLNEDNLSGAFDALLRSDRVPTDVCVLFLNACGKAKALALVRQLQVHLACKKTDYVLGEHILLAFAKCGALEDALCAFLALPQKTVFAWTAMVSAYAESGNGLEALHFYRHMWYNNVTPNGYTFVALVKACSSIPDLGLGKKFHAIAKKHGFTTNAFVGSALISMYGICGCITEAENVFNGIQELDVVCWNAMLSAYGEHGYGERILQLYQQMQDEGLKPNQQTFVAAFQACNSLLRREKCDILDGEPHRGMCLVIGNALHIDAEVQASNLLQNPFICSALVSLYGKCDQLVEAEKVFSGVSQRNVVLWGALLTAYIEQDCGEEALKAYRQMLDENICLNQQSYVMAFQACAIIAEKDDLFPSVKKLSPVEVLEIGCALHADAQRMALASDVLVCNSIINMYGTCGCIIEAMYAFDRLPMPSIASWNVMLCVYLGQFQAVEALQLYKTMQEQDVPPDQRTLVVAVRACSEMVEEGHTVRPICLEIGRTLDLDAQRMGWVASAYVESALVSMYAKCGSIEESQQVFKRGFQQRNIVIWNSMLSAFVECGQGEKALQLFGQMQAEQESSLDVLTLGIALQACTTYANYNESWYHVGQGIHIYLCKKGLESDSYVGRALTNMYAELGKLAEAEHLFNKMRHENIASWNAMLIMYVKHGQGHKALELFIYMQENRMALNDTTINCMLQVCVAIGIKETCHHLHFIILCAGYECNSLLASTLTCAYGLCACMLDARDVLDCLYHPDLASWNACIAGYAKEGNSVASVEIFIMMQLADILPDDMTCLSFLCACSHTGRVKDAITCYASMDSLYSVNVGPRHYVAIVDLFGRIGDFVSLENLLFLESDYDQLVVWTSLLGASRIHGHVELGERAFENALNLHPGDAAVCVSLLNIYRAACAKCLT